MPLAPTFRLGPYEIVELLSSGGMGEIYRARDTRLGREVAVKVLSPALAADPSRLARFRKEAQAAGLLDHPNIVAIHDVGVHEGISFVVSEFVDGMSVRSALRDGPLPRPLAIEWAIQVARGLAAAHARGVVHRDLKPENLMVTRDGRVKIVDFGIAKLDEVSEDRQQSIETAHRTAPGTVLGTVAYMSPEQTRGEAVDHRTDIFSLGIILYEMLGGVNPFGRRTTADTISAILRDSPLPLPGISVEVDRIVRRALEKNLGARFQSAVEVAQALEAARPAGATPGRAIESAPGTIAVLPFANMSADPASEYFSDGLAEELIQALTRVRGLRVVAWHSAAQMKGRSLDLRAIGRELNVRTILTGAVRKAGDRVRITARLIDVETGFHLWSDSYDREIADVFAIQEEIARRIAEKLTSALADTHRPARQVGNVDAYNMYLRGRFFLNKRTDDGLRRSVECFETALSLDNRFALAYSGLADAYCLMADYGVAHPAEAMPRAREAAVRALDIDPRSAEAHASFALIRSVYEWEWDEAEALFRRAIELGPGYATAHHWFALDFLGALGRFDEAHEEIDIALHLDPLSLIIQEGKPYLLTLSRRFDEAIAGFRALVDLEPGFYKGYTSMGRALGLKGDYKQAIAMFEKGRALAGDVPSILGALGQTHALAGHVDQARGLLDQLSALSTRRYVASTTFALVHSGLGEFDVALDWLEKGCSQHELSMVGINVHPAYDVLRGQERFSALLRRMRFDVSRSGSVKATLRDE